MDASTGDRVVGDQGFLRFDSPHASALDSPSRMSFAGDLQLPEFIAWVRQRMLGRALIPTLMLPNRWIPRECFFAEAIAAYRPPIRGGPAAQMECLTHGLSWVRSNRLRRRVRKFNRLNLSVAPTTDTAKSETDRLASKTTESVRVVECIARPSEIPRLALVWGDPALPPWAYPVRLR
ncbi:MAG: hypothetical protein AAF958_19455, partial [Planctomycetota bacterium]